jgi:hypothetical protein
VSATYASMHKAMSYGRMPEREAALAAKVAAILAEAEAKARTGNADAVPDPRAERTARSARIGLELGAVEDDPPERGDLCAAFQCESHPDHRRYCQRGTERSGGPRPSQSLGSPRRSGSSPGDAPSRGIVWDRGKDSKRESHVGDRPRCSLH